MLKIVFLSALIVLVVSLSSISIHLFQQLTPKPSVDPLVLATEALFTPLPQESPLPTLQPISSPTAIPKKSPKPLPTLTIQNVSYQKITQISNTTSNTQNNPPSNPSSTSTPK